MARLAMVIPEGVDVETLDEASRVQLDVGGIVAHRPEAGQALGVYGAVLKSSGTLSPRLVELVRLRIAFHNQCRSCMAVRYGDAVDDGVTEDLVCSLERPAESPDLTDAERIALRFADLFATNHLAIDDALYADLGQFFTVGEIVELGLQCALFLGMGRLAATWHVVDDLPEEFRTPGVVTPWGHEGLVVR